MDYASILPELYKEVADPELPSSHKGVLRSLFGGGHQSVVDHKELCKCIEYLSTLQ